ncbi:hypothetical protein, partial [Klebsiella aerogenes]|uniref:hypothetical protein n=1 Tax=Klebsiella aerogenes TaxID=548 RepID=UPI00195491FB
TKALTEKSAGLFHRLAVQLFTNTGALPDPKLEKCDERNVWLIGLGVLQEAVIVAGAQVERGLLHWHVR